MRHENVQNNRRRRSGESGIFVARNEHGVRLFLLRHPPYLSQHAAGHRAMATAVAVKKCPGLNISSSVKSEFEHVGIEALARVDKHVCLARCFHDGVRIHASADQL